MTGKVGDLLSHNMFAYCESNPVMRADTSGHGWFDFLICAVAVAVIVVCVIKGRFMLECEEAEIVRKSSILYARERQIQAKFICRIINQC